MDLKGKNFLTLRDFTPDEITGLIDLAADLKAKKKAGKDKLRPVYANFKKFFDYEKEVNRVLGKNKTDSRFVGIGKLLKKQ